MNLLLNRTSSSTELYCTAASVTACFKHARLLTCTSSAGSPTRHPHAAAASSTLMASALAAAPLARRSTQGPLCAGARPSALRRARLAGGSTSVTKPPPPAVPSSALRCSTPRLRRWRRGGGSDSGSAAPAAASARTIGGGARSRRRQGRPARVSSSRPRAHSGAPWKQPHPCCPAAASRRRSRHGSPPLGYLPGPAWARRLPWRVAVQQRRAPSRHTHACERHARPGARATVTGGATRSHDLRWGEERGGGCCRGGGAW